MATAQTGRSARTCPCARTDDAPTQDRLDTRDRAATLNCLTGGKREPDLGLTDPLQDHGLEGFEPRSAGDQPSGERRRCYLGAAEKVPALKLV